MFMHKVLPITFMALLLSGCLASAPRIPPYEGYRGPLIAAITPFQSQAGQMTSWLLKHELEAQLPERLRASEVFSAVQDIHTARSANEADIIIEPSLLETPVTGQGKLGVRIRATTKTSGAVTVEQDYWIPCRPCALGTLEPQALETLTDQINRDLKRTFGRSRVD
jgi:hypothetical protein